MDRPPSAKIPREAFAAVIRGYLTTSQDFTQPPPLGLAEGTKIGYRVYLRLAELPETLGGLDVNVIHPADVQLFLDQFSDRPGAQHVAKTALSAVESWAMPRRKLPYPIMTGVTIGKSGGGHIPWSDEQVKLAEQHAKPNIARIVTLAANTGQRGIDLVRMCPTDLEEFRGRMGINVRQIKTGLQIWIPLTRPLEAAMAKWPLVPGPYLRQEDGSAWSGPRSWSARAQMSSAWVRERDRNPALAPCRNVIVPGLPEPRSLVVHGLRATACVRLWEADCPTTLISKMVGLSVPMVENYVRFAAQRVSALAAVKYLDGTGTERVVSLHPSNAKLSG